MEADQALRERHPELGSLGDFEEWMAKELPATMQKRQGASIIITIPIVFHVIHDGEDVGTNSNITHAQVLSQIDVLNEDFRKMTGTPGFNSHPDGADVEIEFCPALYDPMGNLMAEPGVNRVDRNAKGFSSPPYSNTSYIDNTIKPNTQWDPEFYCNYWCLDLGGGLLGYAQFPTGSGLPGLFSSGAASTDGVVIGHKYTGRPPHNPYPGPYNLGRTATHEIGHWLGLRHIWGDGGCSQDDFCNDTPASDGSNFGCPSNHTSCGTVDMIENYMDYTNDACMNIFTQDQKARMLTVMANSPRRANLATSPVCQPQAAPVVAYGLSDTVICQGELVGFQDLSSNFPSQWEWTFTGPNGQIVDTNQNPVIAFDSVGFYNVQLIVANSAGGDTLFDSLSFEIVSALGFDVVSVDSDSSACPGSNSGSIQVQVTGGTKPYSFSVNNGATFGTDSVFTGLSAGVYSVLVYDANGCSLDTSQIHVYGLDNPKISNISINPPACFGEPGGFTVQMQPGNGPFAFSLDGGSFGTDSVFTNVSTGFHSVSVMDTNGCSISQTVNLVGPGPISTYVFSVVCDDGTNNGSFAFSTSGGTGSKTVRLNGNAVTSPVSGLTYGTYDLIVEDGNGCLDTTQVEIANCIGLEEEILKNAFSLYPNPSQGNVKLDWNANSGVRVLGVEILQITGQVVDKINVQDERNQVELNTGSLPKGTYLVRVETNLGLWHEVLIAQ